MDMDLLITFSVILGHCAFWMALLRYFELHSDNFKRFLEQDISIPGFKPLGEKIHQQWDKVASLVEECNNLHATPARSKQLWKMAKLQKTSPLWKADTSLMAESLGRFQSFLVASAEKGRKLCHKYLKGNDPSCEVMGLNTLFSLIVDTCQKCSPEAPCALSELKKSTGGWQKAK